MRRALCALLPILLVAAACQSTPPPLQPPVLSVFFPEDGAGLDVAARGVVAEAVSRAQANPSLPIRVLGFAAPDTGSAAFNRSLAETRARGVADALAAGGVPANRIQIENRGAVPFQLIPTESRRVEIRVGI